MGSIKRMTGTSWHVNILSKKEEDNRRHKSRCVFYNKENGFCSKIVSRCPGSAHCKYYSENAQKSKTEQDKYVTQRATPFQNKKNINVRDIVVPMYLSKKKYKSPIQIGHLIKHYEKFNELLGTVIVTIEDGKYQLVSGLPFLNAARALNLKEIAATYVESFNIRKVNSKKNFKINQWVENKSVGIGKIIKIDDSSLTVKYDNGSSKTYPIDNCSTFLYVL